MPNSNVPPAPVSRPCGSGRACCARRPPGIVALTVLQALWGDLG